MYPGTYGEKYPDRPAVIMAGSGETLTYAELDARSNQLAHVLRAAGLRRGDQIAMFMENQIRFMEIAWAALRSGLYVTCVNSHLTAPEVAYIVKDCEAKAFISSAALAGVATDVEFGGLRLMTDRVEGGFESYEAAVGSQPTTRIADESSGTAMLYSSGTTGRPKGVLRPLPKEAPWENDARLAGLGTLYHYREEMTYLSPAPMYHAAPLAFSVSAQRFGGTVVMMERFDPADGVRLIEQHRVTHSQWVPTMFVRMLRLPDDEKYGHDLSTHEVAIHAAAPCPVAV